jgi:heme A synthase
MSPIQISDRLIFRRFGTLLTSASGLAFLLISLGPLVRTAQYDLHCSDWPACFIKNDTFTDSAIQWKYLHLLLQGALGIILVTAGVRIFRLPVLRAALKSQIFAVLVFFFIQAALGEAIALQMVQDHAAEARFLNALLFFTILLWTTIRVQQLGTEQALRRSSYIPLSVKLGFGATTLILFAQIALGGLVSSQFAGRVCPDFPTCHGEWIPPLLFPFVIQMVHRYTAFLALTLLIALRLLTHRVTLPLAGRFGVIAAPWLLIVQIGLGIINIFYVLPTPAFAAHLANAMVLFSIMFTGTMAVFANGTQSFSDHHVRKSVPCKQLKVGDSTI